MIKQFILYGSIGVSTIISGAWAAMWFKETCVTFDKSVSVIIFGSLLTTFGN